MRPTALRAPHTTTPPPSPSPYTPLQVINELFGAASFESSARWSNPSLLLNLLIFTVCKFVFTCIAVGAPLSCGVYTPVFLIGAASGRFFGEVQPLTLCATRP